MSALTSDQVKERMQEGADAAYQYPVPEGARLALVDAPELGPDALARIKEAIKADMDDPRQQIVFGYPVVDDELGGMVVPAHTTDEIFKAAREVEQSRKRRATAWAVVWTLLDLMVFCIITFLYADGPFDLARLFLLVWASNLFSRFGRASWQARRRV